MRIALLLLFTSVLYGADTAHINQALLERIPAQMKTFVDQHVIAGIVTLVSHDGQVAEFDAEGMADVEAGRAMKKDTIFQIMSMTKPVTAVGIMMLAEEGKLTLREPIENLIPEFRKQRVVTPDGPDSGRLGTPLRPVTIRDLMTHTSGMFDLPPGEIPDYSQKMNIPLAQLMPYFARQPLLFQPGTHWSYSSPGIDILGRIIEICSGQKYEDFIQERILKPLGMKDSFFYPPQDKLSRIAMVYVRKDGKLVRAPGTILGGDPSKYRAGATYPAPAWGLYSTAEDLSHFYQMMLNDGVFAGRRYLSPFSVRIMTEVQTGDLNPSGWLRGSGYGLAWEVVKDPYGELTGQWKGSYGHSGAFGTQGWVDPEHHLIRVLLIQRADGGTDSVRDTFLTMSAASLN